MRAQDSTTAKTVAKISTVSNTTGGKKSVARRSTGRNHPARPLLPAIRHPDRCVRENDPLVGHRGPYALRRASHGARPPGLVLVREPDELGLERAHPQLALGARLVELAEPNRHVAADDDWTPARLDDDHLQAACVARRRDEPEPVTWARLAVELRLRRDRRRPKITAGRNGGS
jgi:hypothetical protein